MPVQEDSAFDWAIFCRDLRLLFSSAPKFLVVRRHKGTAQGRVSHPRQRTAAFPGCLTSLLGGGRALRLSFPASSPAPALGLDFQSRHGPVSLPAPGEPRRTPQRRPASRPTSSHPSLELGGAAANPPLPARCHLNSPVDSRAEAEGAFAKGEGSGRRASAPLPGCAAPAGGAVARSPPAKPLAPRSHPTRGCSGGLRGLARGPAFTGARASGCVPPELH